ncbi:MAG TPA: tetratricopeptide repeat protein [Thermoanaerobaculia bacterium]|nr:tetratricopeptide repeat protein [Thermoanaerobaculia bacterium]
MNEPAWDRIEALYSRLAGLPEEARERSLREAEADSPSVARRVRELLEADASSSALLPVGGGLDGRLWEESDRDEALPSMAGRIVGRFRLLEQIGEGGMAVVYRAERCDPSYPQQVAVKLMRTTSGHEELRRRFRAEGSILARLSHPGIASFLDGGFDAEGRPYMAVELVEGLPIDRYCDQRRLGVAGRLELLQRVCEAVAFAHRRLVVHRDVKPANVLVSQEGGVKLLDFGIAKLLADDGDARIETRTGLSLLTPRFASPEQVRGEPVTTASDVYQLGLVLYELLCGRAAHDLEGASASELVHAVCEREPPPPSVRAAQASREVAAARGEPDPGALARRLRGDLDTIAAKALAKEPDRRYASAAALADDLERHLRGLPIAARRPTLRYVATKLARRYRWRFALAIALGLSLLAGVIAFAWQWGVARGERDRAVAAAARAEQVTQLLIGAFEAADPTRTPNRGLLARDVLDQSLWRIDLELARDPDLQAEMLGVLGRVYRSLGEGERSERLLERALALRREEQPPSPESVAKALQDLGEQLVELDRSEEARRHLEEALAIRRELYGERHEAVAASLSSLGRLAAWLHDFEEAERRHRQALLVREQVLGPSHAATGDSAEQLGRALFAQRRYDDARPMLERALAIRRESLPAAHPEIASALDALASLELNTGAPDSAETRYREALEVRRGVLGDRHPATLVSMNNLANLLTQTTRLDEAAELLTEAVEGLRDALGDDHPYRASALVNLGNLYKRLGRFAEAEARYREALAVRRARSTEPHATTATILYQLGLTERNRGRLAEAELHLSAALAMYREVLSEDDPRIANAQVNLGDVLLGLGRLAEAEPLVLAGLASREASYGIEDWRTALAQSVAGELRWRQGRRTEARVLLEAAVDTLTRQAPELAATTLAQRRLEALDD